MFTSKKADDKCVYEYLCGIIVLCSGAFSGFLASRWGQIIPPLCLPPLLPVFVLCSNSSGDGGVGGGEWSCTIECRMASSSSESVLFASGPLLHSPSPRYVTPPTSCGDWTWLWECHFIVTWRSRGAALPWSEGVQARGEVLVEQYGQVGFLWLDLPPVDPAGHRRVPAEVSWVYVQDAWKEKEEIQYM